MRRVRIDQSTISEIAVTSKVIGLVSRPSRLEDGRDWRVTNQEMSESLSKSILIVEDEPMIRESFRMLMELEGYRVFTASNGEEALQILRTMQPHPGLVFLDLLMPIMTGMEFLDAKGLDAAIMDIPVCIVSGVAEQPTVSGVVGFMRKPIDFDGLLKFVRNYCGSPGQGLSGE